MSNPNQMRKLMENFKNYTNLAILKEQKVYKTKHELIDDLEKLIRDITHSKDFRSSTDSVLSNLMHIKYSIKTYFPDDVTRVNDKNLHEIIPDDEFPYFYPTLIEIEEELFAEELDTPRSAKLADAVYINGKIYNRNDNVISSIINAFRLTPITNVDDDLPF